MIRTTKKSHRQWHIPAALLDVCVRRLADTVSRYDLTGEHPEWKINLACNAMKCGQLVGGLYSAHIRLPLQMNRIISGARAIRSRQLFADCAKCLALRRKLLLTQIFIEEIQFKHERKYKHYIVIWHGTKCFVFHTLVTWFPPAISSLSLSRYRLCVCVYRCVYVFVCVYRFCRRRSSSSFHATFCLSIAILFMGKNRKLSTCRDDRAWHVHCAFAYNFVRLSNFGTFWSNKLLLLNIHNKTPKIADICCCCRLRLPSKCWSK